MLCSLVPYKGGIPCPKSGFSLIARFNIGFCCRDRGLPRFDASRTTDSTFARAGKLAEYISASQSASFYV